jgi:hypothetical protein
MDRNRFNIKEFIDDEDFHPDQILRRYPHARRFLDGSLFISHAGVDYRRIYDYVVSPVVSDRFYDGYFLHNRDSSGSGAYKQLVRAALHWCDKFMIVISRNSIDHEWVRAEVDWAVRNDRSIIRCLFDDSDPAQLHPALVSQSWRAQPTLDLLTVDFRGELESARHHLAEILDTLLLRSPYQSKRFESARHQLADVLEEVRKLEE